MELFGIWNLEVEIWNLKFGILIITSLNHSLILSFLISVQSDLFKLTWGYNTMIEPHLFLHKEFTKEYPLVKEILSSGIEISLT